jgi:signal transduction histidine kinase
MLTSVDAFLKRASHNAILILALGLALLLGVADYYSSPDLLVLYIGPIVLAAWYGGTRPGAVIAIYCALAGFLTKFITNLQVLKDPANASLFHDEIWAFSARLIIFLFIARLVAKLQASRSQQVELTQFIVHDLRSPIASSITGLMTLEMMDDNMDETQKEMVGLALVSNQRALTLVNSILDVSKLETGKMTIKKENVVISPFLSDCIDLVGLWANTQGIRFDKNLEAEVAYLDPDLTQRVIVNLLSNALKYSPENGTITVSVSPGVRDDLKFGVHDQGRGIPPEYLHTIFEPFAQVKGTKGGTGLGLTFCRLAIQAQGGKIWVESTVGKGTSMYFTLPQVIQTAA